MAEKLGGVPQSFLIFLDFLIPYTCSGLRPIALLSLVLLASVMKSSYVGEPVCHQTFSEKPL
jgi:hypothetical protein